MSQTEAALIKNGSVTADDLAATLDLSGKTVTLADGSVTAGQLATTLDLSGKTVTLPSGVGGKFASYAIIVDQKSATADGGTFTSGDWRTRDLNTELSDPDGIVTISSNQFTLAAGTYFIRWAAPAFGVERHQTRLQDITNATVREYGLSCYSASDLYAATHSFGSTRVIPGASTTYEIQHHSSFTKSTNGFGVHGGAGIEQYTLVEIFREA